MLITHAPKGTKDILPKEVYRWHHMEEVMRSVCRSFGYREIRVPIFEHTELFLRGVGDTTDIVQKEMYTFTDKGNRSVTLRPEGTAGVGRAFIENKLFNDPLPAKMYYCYSPTFRYERPQAGRLREHHQFGVECYGASDASMDAEVILLALKVLDQLGLKGLEVNINSIGCKVCRPRFIETLKAYLRPHLNEMCETCQDRFDRNALRILDCKCPACKAVVADAPSIVECLCPDCARHFAQLQDYLDQMEVVYHVNPLIVRGLDYYTRTVFEIIAPQIGAQSTVCGGGRYDGLLEELGGPSLPGIGFGMGMERLLLALEIYGEKKIEEPPLLDVYVAPLGETSRHQAFALTQQLRGRGIVADMDHMARSVKAQFKYADKTGCRYVVILGEQELEQGAAKIRDMKANEETLVPLGEVAAFLTERI